MDHLEQLALSYGVSGWPVGMSELQDPVELVVNGDKHKSLINPMKMDLERLFHVMKYLMPHRLWKPEFVF